MHDAARFVARKIAPRPPRPALVLRARSCWFQELSTLALTHRLRGMSLAPPWLGWRDADRREELMDLAYLDVLQRSSAAGVE